MSESGLSRVFAVFQTSYQKVKFRFRSPTLILLFFRLDTSFIMIVKFIVTVHFHIIEN